MKKRRAGQTNAKRQICTDERREILSRIAETMSYGGNPEHKSDPGLYNLHPPSVPRLDKSLCDPTGVNTRAKARNILRRGVMKGLVSEQWRGDYPQNIWSVYTVGDRTWVIEAQLENQVQGVYHAYPLPEDDPFRLIVLKRWHEETENGT
jgi:hypothetical protein